MKKPLFFLLHILITHCIYSQTVVSKKWDARFGGINGDGLYVIVQANDGGYILGGSSNSGISGNKTQPNWDATLNTVDYWIVKTDANGNYLWDKRYGTSDDDPFMSLTTTKDGGYILGGWTAAGISGDKTQPSQGGFDYWVIKVDSLGNKQWDKRFGGSNDDILDRVIQTIDGGYILVGFSSSGISGDKTQPNWDPSESSADYWIVKIDSTGNKQWDKRFGGTGDDLGRDIIQTPDGGYLVGGSSGSDSSGDKTQPNFAQIIDNYWIVKIDSVGNKQWDKIYGGILGESYSNSLNTTDGNYLLGGTSYDSISGNKTAPSCGYWLVKIDTSGNKLGDWAYGNCGTMNSMSHTSDGGYLLTGVSASILSIKIDSQMNIVWSKALTLVGGTSSSYSAGALEGSSSCFVIGVNTTAGIGGDKTQPNWDPTNNTDDYWIVEYCDSFPTGILEPEGAMHLLVYPNPTSSDLYINIQKDNLTEASFTLTTTSGQYIYQSTADHLAHSYTKILDLSLLPTGVYLLDVVVDGERIVKKVVKE